MVGDSQRAVAVWAVLVVPFALLAIFRWNRDALDLQFVVAYWFAPAVLTAIGVLPPPWKRLPE